MKQMGSLANLRRVLCVYQFLSFSWKKRFPGNAEGRFGSKIPPNKQPRKMDTTTMARD